MDKSLSFWFQDKENTEKSDVKWASGYPKTYPKYQNVMLRISFDAFFDEDDGFLNAPSAVTGYPLCRAKLIAGTYKIKDIDKYKNNSLFIHYLK